MENIVLTRIDSRLIHGQVMTKWVKQVSADRIIIVSDELANDEFMRTVYLMSAPEGITIDCYTEEEMVNKTQNNEIGTGKILLLLPNLEVMRNIVVQGVKVKDIQIGGLGGAPNRKVVYKNITLDDADVERIEYLTSQGVDVYFQIIPEDSPLNSDEVLKNYRKGV